MSNDAKIEPREDANESNDEARLLSRRNFLVGLRKWSTIIIGGALLSGVLPQQEAAGWVNGRGGAWVNGRGGWINGGGGGGGSWVNRSGGGGAGWVNRAGGGGGAWVNGRGGGGGAWVNR